MNPINIDLKNLGNYEHKAYETILEAMKRPRKRCEICYALTHELEEGLCIACYNIEFSYKHRD